ncbi:MAG: ATP-NAD kinase family protein [Candidatus Thorarchaeota archaeon]|nr:ATP-NAD kinase family protein [Candidatus Thorarchaeota archaeon]
MRIGLLVNPIAGMGGRVGLKGTDGVLDEARRRGAVPVAPQRAAEFLSALRESQTLMAEPVTLVVCPGPMGADIVAPLHIPYEALDISIGELTNAEDTRRCVKALYDRGVRFLVFVGGDGTARDILDVVSEHGLTDMLVLGVPSGVKMYSGVFVISPKDAPAVIQLVMSGEAKPSDFEVMDADEDAIREDRFSLRLYGYLRGPAVPARFQGAKQASPETIDEHEAQEAIARYIVEKMRDDEFYILGPGTTVKTIADLLGVRKTVLGVDIYHHGTAYNDVNEEVILKMVADFTKVRIIVSPIGHQGMLFGRGNQQISPEVIRRAGRDNIWVVCTQSKLQGVERGVLRVDTGDASVDEMLRGYMRVITDYAEIRLVSIE